MSKALQPLNTRGMETGRVEPKLRTKYKLRDMQEFIKQKYQIEDFNPANLMAAVAVECLEPQWITNPETGESVCIPPDRELAVAALAKAAPYVLPTLKSVEIKEEEKAPITVDEAKEKLAKLLGVEILDTNKMIDATPA